MVNILKTLIIVVIMSFSVTALAEEDKNKWTREDSLREAAALIVRTLDWGTTVQIAAQPEKYHEMNPILGRHPSRDKVNAYFVLGNIIHPIISYHLPRPYREYWQYLSIGVSSALVANNLSIGLQVKW